jgi:hypothetical protein
MRKVFLSVAALMVGGVMLHGAFACELNRQVRQPNSAIFVWGACSGSNCLGDPPQDPLTSDPVQDRVTAYFDPGTYSGSNGLLEWLMTSLIAQSQYKLGAGFAPLPMDANAQYRKLLKTSAPLELGSRSIARDASTNWPGPVWRLH